MRLGSISNCTNKASPAASPTCYSRSSCPGLLDNAKHGIVSVLVFGDVLQRFAFSVHYECVQRQEERERETKQVVVKQKGSQYFD